MDYVALVFRFVQFDLPGVRQYDSEQRAACLILKGEDWFLDESKRGCHFFADWRQC